MVIPKQEEQNLIPKSVCYSLNSFTLFIHQTRQTKRHYSTKHIKSRTCDIGSLEPSTSFSVI